MSDNKECCIIHFSSMHKFCPDCGNLIDRSMKVPLQQNNNGEIYNLIEICTKDNFLNTVVNKDTIKDIDKYFEKRGDQQLKDNVLSLRRQFNSDIPVYQKALLERCNNNYNILILIFMKKWINKFCKINNTYIKDININFNIVGNEPLFVDFFSYRVEPEEVFQYDLITMSAKLTTNVSDITYDTWVKQCESVSYNPYFEYFYVVPYRMGYRLTGGVLNLSVKHTHANDVSYRLMKFRI